MAEKWYCKLADQELGPFTAESLKQLAAEKRLAPADPVRREGDTKWYQAKQVKGLFPSLASENEKAEKTSDSSEHPAGEKKPSTKIRVARAIIDNPAPASAASAAVKTGHLPKGIPAETSFALDFGPSAAGVSAHDRGGKKSAFAKNHPEDPTDPAFLKKQKKQQQFMILAGVTGGVGLLAILAIIYLVMSSGGGKKAPEKGDAPTEVTAAVKSGEKNVSKEPEEVQEAAGSMTELLAKGKMKPASSDVSEKENDAQPKMMLRGVADTQQDADDAEKTAEVKIEPQERGGLEITFEKCELAKTKKALEVVFSVRKMSQLGSSAWKKWQDEEYAKTKSRMEKEVLQGLGTVKKDDPESVTFTYVVRLPAGKAKDLHLEIPGAGKEPFEFQIPRKLWEPEEMLVSVVADKKNEGVKNAEKEAGKASVDDGGFQEVNKKPRMEDGLEMTYRGLKLDKMGAAYSLDIEFRAQKMEALKSLDWTSWQKERIAGTKCREKSDVKSKDFGGQATVVPTDSESTTFTYSVLLPADKTKDLYLEIPGPKAKSFKFKIPEDVWKSGKAPTVAAEEEDLLPGDVKDDADADGGKMSQGELQVTHSEVDEVYTEGVDEDEMDRRRGRNAQLKALEESLDGAAADSGGEDSDDLDFDKTEKKTTSSKTTKKAVSKKDTKGKDTKKTSPKN